MIVELLSALEAPRFGGKASQLAHSLRGGLPVPNGVAIACDSVRDARSLAEEIVQRMPIDRGVAVRSSAIGEDGATASFAGQHATCLGIRDVDALARAITLVRESASTEAALAYRARLGLCDAPSMGIVVQTLVHADVAGVLFSRHPLTGADERVIEATYGLGEAVVAGIVTPDSYRVARGGKVLERVLGEKDLMITYDPHGEGTMEEAVPADRMDAFCLSDADLVALDGLTSRCESLFGEHRDIEFAFAGGTLHLLQCRAITRVGT